MEKIYTTVEQIVRIYLQRIANGELLAGDKVESEENLARILGLSRSTARKALLQLEGMGILTGSRRKVRRISENARSLVSVFYDGLTYDYGGKKIAIVVLDDRRYMADMRDEAVKRGKLFNWMVDIFYNPDLQSERESFEFIVENKYDGCIITPLIVNGNYELYNYEILKKAGIPFVLLERPPKTLPCDAIYANDYLGSYMMTKSLYAGGAMTVVYVTDGKVNSMIDAERRAAYEDVVTSRGAKPVVFDVRKNFRAKFTAFLRGDMSVIGINAYSDDMLEPVMSCLAEAGKSENDYRIYAWAEKGETAYGRHISLVRVPKEFMIDRSFDMILERIVHGRTDSYRHEVFEVEVGRETQKKRKIK